MKLTDRAIQSLKPKPEPYEVFDSEFRGGSFSVRVSAAGRKTFTLMYRNAERHQRRLTLGEYGVLTLSDARSKARSICAKVQMGGDPVAERQDQRLAQTFEDLFNLYMDRYARENTKTWKEDQRKADKDVLPTLGKMKLKTIRREHLIEVLDRIAQRGSPVTANRTRGLLSRVYAFGVGRGLLEYNLVRDIPPLAKEHSRDRVLSEDEIRRMWTALDKQLPLTAATFKLRLITGQRGIEVLSMRWRDIDGDTWTIPAEISKNRMAHRVPLSTMALKVIEGVASISGNGEWLFPSPTGRGHMGRLGKALDRIRTTCGETDKQEWFTAHDLRRTAATFMTRYGVSRLILSQVLNHSSRGVTAIYDRHGYEREKREALELWSQTLERILSDETSNVVKMKGGQAS